MSDVKKASDEYLNIALPKNASALLWHRINNAFLAGAAWQREQDAKVAEAHFASVPITEEMRFIHRNNTALSIAEAIRSKHSNQEAANSSEIPNSSKSHQEAANGDGV